jgi:hypothetical protein
MVRLADVSFPHTKVAALATLLVLLALAGAGIAKQFSQTAPVNTLGPQIIKTSKSPLDVQNVPSAPADSLSVSAQSQNSSQTSLNVNGQQIDVPDNGTVSQTIENQNGTTTVNVNSNSTKSTTGTGTNTSRSSVNVHVSSNSSERNQ